MTYLTHKQYSIAFAYVTLMLLYSFKLCDINYYLCFPVIILISQWGAKFPDLDHDFKNIKDKNVLTWTINKLIHLTGGKHRSWQTHSIDIFVYYSVASYFMGSSIFEGTNLSVYMMINYGFASGWLSHLYSDMLNGVGIRMFCFSKKKVALVPRKLHIRIFRKDIVNIKFNTGGEWEDFNYRIMRKADVVLGLVAVIYPSIPYIADYIKNNII